MPFPAQNLLVKAIRVAQRIAETCMANFWTFDNNVNANYELPKGGDLEVLVKPVGKAQSISPEVRVKPVGKAQSISPEVRVKPVGKAQQTGMEVSITPTSVTVS